MDLPKESLVDLYRMMQRIRAFEDRVGELFLEGKIWGAVHLYTGEEAMATGVCMALNKNDYIASTHRGHGHCLAKGGDPNLMMAEIFGRSTGYCKGKGGSMHIADVETGNLGANAIVGDGIAIATGAALAIRIKQTDQVSVAFFGDGATGSGTFHEAVNLAAVLNLPIVFICENNQYAVSTSMTYSSPVETLAERAKAYGLPAVTVNGNDVLEVYTATKKAVDRVRAGEGPGFVEGLTYRIEGHYKGDPEVYRSKMEVEDWRENKDPIQKFRVYLIESGTLTAELLDQIDSEIYNEIEDAVTFALESPIPPLDSLHEDLFAE